eukprot:5407000-Pyramimonas_sp.AAC.1
MLLEFTVNRAGRNYTCAWEEGVANLTSHAPRATQSLRAPSPALRCDPRDRGQPQIPYIAIGRPRLGLWSSNP